MARFLYSIFQIVKRPSKLDNRIRWLMLKQPYTAANMSNINDDEPDEWDQRIMNTGCHEENLALQLCHADEGDWRKCLKQMAAFKKCWSDNKNNERTHTVNNDEAKPA